MKQNCSARSTWLFLLFIAVDGVSLIFGQVFPTRETVQPDEYFSWKNLEWNFDNQEAEEAAIKNGEYKRDRSVPSGFAIWRDKIFITVPRRLPGVPATLNYIRNTEPREMSPKLTPYPSWSYNQPGNCDDTIVSAYKIEVDECDRLWIIDTGSMVINFQKTLTCSPKLIVFDLLTDEIVRRHDLSITFIPQGTFAANIAVESDSTNCEDTFAYGISVNADSLMVYNWLADRSWLAPIKEIDGFTHRETDFHTYPIILSGTSRYKKLYFNPFNKFREYSIFTRTLTNKMTATNAVNKNMIFVRDYPSYSSSAVIAQGNTFYSDSFNNAICCWSPAPDGNSKHDRLGVIAKNDTTLNFPNDIKIHNDTIWILSNRLPKFRHRGGLDYEDINFRLLKISLQEINVSGICGLLELDSELTSE